MHCGYCRGPLLFVPGQGYLHMGGGIYVEKCELCNSKFSRSAEEARNKKWACPDCGADRRYVVDDHAAMPVF